MIHFPVKIRFNEPTNGSSKISLRTWLLLCTAPWIFFLVRLAMYQIPYTWEYSPLPFLKNRPVPWSIWYCTEDTTGNEGKIFLPQDSAYILYGGAKYFRPLTKEEKERTRPPLPPSYCSTEDFEFLALPDSVRLLWDIGGIPQEKWIQVKSRLAPKWGMNREYIFALRTRYNGQVDFFSDPDSINRYVELRNAGFWRRDPANEPSKPHSSVW
ncbi:MAG: hypothetical protein IPK50_08770 [Fibrobacterota bacterium]|nr:hypothetical protein [Fibrobacterota bacterium]QQS06974.1 MAG: hypothetical protein IPK50_08770 [Fibrobacterota bacterium]